MKSLEIINNNIDWYGDLTLKAKDVETIKQDLEVLKIIWEKKVDVWYLTHALVSYDSLEDILNCYNTSNDYHLTMEELLKLKQWLEENENDR